MSWYYESDGGGWYEHSNHVIQPRTHYVTDGWDRIDCDSRREAVELARRLNEKEKHNGNVC